MDRNIREEPVTSEAGTVGHTITCKFDGATLNATDLLHLGPNHKGQKSTRCNCNKEKSERWAPPFHCLSLYFGLHCPGNHIHKKQRSESIVAVIYKNWASIQRKMLLLIDVAGLWMKMLLRYRPD